MYTQFYDFRIRMQVRNLKPYKCKRNFILFVTILIVKYLQNIIPKVLESFFVIATRNQY